MEPGGCVVEGRPLVAPEGRRKVCVAPFVRCNLYAQVDISLKSILSRACARFLVSSTHSGDLSRGAIRSCSTSDVHHHLPFARSVACGVIAVEGAIASGG